MKKKKTPIIWLIVLIIGGAGYFYLKKPTQQTYQKEELIAFQKQANQELNVKIPLLLQKDPRWADIAYGFDSKQDDLATNGCAIVSLAMVLAYVQGKEVLPTDILDWAQNNYFVAGQGTSWQIFEDFSRHYQINYQALGNDFQAAKEQASNHKAVIVSVNPGTFTTTGHIMVLMMNDQGQIIVLDPNDSPEKNHYQQVFSDETFQQEGIAYWAFG